MRDLDILKGNIDSTGKMTGKEIWAAINSDKEVAELFRADSVYRYWLTLEGNQGKTMAEFWEVIKTTGETGSSEDCNAAWNAFYKEISGKDYSK